VCGAALAEGETCRQRFERCLTMDFEHPTTYGAVHMFIVACYMLQHNAYAREGWLATRAMLAEAIARGAAPAELRQRHRGELDSGRRAWRVTRGERHPGGAAIVWTRTITDVRLDAPEHYQEDARRWAESILADTEALARAPDRSEARRP